MSKHLISFIFTLDLQDIVICNIGNIWTSLLWSLENASKPHSPSRHLVSHIEHTHTYWLLHIHPGASNWEMTEQKPTICMEEEGLPLSFSTQQEISQNKEVILPCWECLWLRIVFVKSSRCASFTASLSSPGYCAPEAWWCGLKRGGWRRERKGEGEWVRKGEGEWVSECVCERERERERKESKAPG